MRPYKFLVFGLMKKLVGAFGYGLHRTRFDIKKHGYTNCPPYTYSTYSPWFSEWFQKIYELFQDVTVLTADRCYMLYRFSQHCINIPGDFAECGVYKGGSAALIAHVIQSTSNPTTKLLHLFDTFKGMPKEGVPDSSDHQEGDMGDVSLTRVKAYLKGYLFTIFYPGVIPETFKHVEKKKFAFVHIDVDLFKTSKDCCEFFYDRLTSGAIMVFDDYGFPRYEYAEKKAVDEFFADKPENPISLRTGQCIVIKV